MINDNMLVLESVSIKEALKKLSKTGHKTLLVVDSSAKLLGTITDGDIRRYILKGEGLEGAIKDVYNKKPIMIEDRDYSIEKVKSVLINNKIELVPIVNSRCLPVDFVTWNQAFSDGGLPKVAAGNVTVPVVIMAGGKGTRLEPFCSVFPKALIPVGEKPIIEIIIDEFRRHGINKFYLTLNHKAEMIESYFNSAKKPYEVNYVREKDYLGTAGSLKLLDGSIGDIFIVSNCDVIVKANFEEVVNFHKENSVTLTILSSIQHYRIPYGVIKFKDGGEVTDTIEKPEYTFTINAGVYVLDKEALSFIPKDTHLDMTDLIKILIKHKKKVITYPVNENDYIDIGQWEEYKKAIGKLQFIR